MKRHIEQKLLEWKDRKRRKPLILRGARQVGKTYSLKKFGQHHFENLVYIDLERHPDWHGIFSGDLSAKKICSELEIVSREKIIPGRSLLFLDEIQSCPRAIMALRYFYEDLPDLHFAAASSLLEFAL
ncbi:MAG: nuclease, partial [Candidatus Electrothrix sp. ATG1]|nr:nuclease [Candidatus Electrothrix sp. ATG1]